MAGFPLDLYAFCRNTLLRCDEFGKQSRLQTVFVTDELYPLRSGLPDADSTGERVDACLDYLIRKRLDDGRFVLPMFLQAMAIRYPEGTDLYTDLQALVSLVSRALASSDMAFEDVSTAPLLNAAVAEARFFPRRRTGMSSTRTLAAVAGGAFPGLSGELGLSLDALLAPEERLLSDPAQHRTEELEFLNRVEALIEDELRKSGDRHFVELSMKLAQPGANRDARLQRNFALVFGDTGTPDATIPSLVELETALRTYRALVLLGTPGSGKTTVLQHLALLLIRAYREQRSALLPLFVPLTWYAVDPRDGRFPRVQDFLKEYVVRLVGEQHFVARHFDGLAKFGRFLFILDGLDQMHDRRSDTARLEMLRQVEADLRKTDTLLRIVRLFRQQQAASHLIRAQQAISTQLAPQVDPREEEIEELPDLFPSPVITSCRLHDFVGAPDWQRLVILPMNEAQITEFISQYAPEADGTVRQEWESVHATRSLISNPFYLRMLVAAFEHSRSVDGALSPEFRQALGRRGRLLEFLIRQAVERELEDEPDLQPDEVIDRLGALAYYMLERNLIGAIPQDTVQRFLGDQSLQILKIGQDVNLLSVWEGLPVSIEFNHQLFLEFLLAYHLKQQSQRAGGFEEGLSLLACRGDRWAETVKLLFEMVSDSDRQVLIAQFVGALQVPANWDIATRVLSDIGPSVAPRLIPLLSHPDELTRRGVASILGRIDAAEYSDTLTALRGDPAWRVRRAAVEALTAMKQPAQLRLFDQDPHPMVIRALFEGRLLLEQQPMDIAQAELASPEAKRQEQMAWAVHNLAGELHKRPPGDSFAEMLVLLMTHGHPTAKLLGYLTISQMPGSLKRRLKPELLRGALEEDREDINYVARRAVAHLLNPADLQRLETRLPTSTRSAVAKAILFSPGDEEVKAEKRAYLLLTEAREETSLSTYFGSLLSAQPQEIQLLTQRLSKRNDALALAILTHLLGHAHAADWAAAALALMGPDGVGHLMAVLDDPVPAVRLGAAQALKFCRLPHGEARRVRRILRDCSVRTHPTNPLSLAPAEDDDKVVRFVGTAIGTLSVYLSMPFLPWAVARLASIDLSFAFWLRLLLYRSPTQILFSSSYKVSTAKNVERLVFSQRPLEPGAEFWMVRGRLMRAVGRNEEACLLLHRSLAREPDLMPARLELALIERAQGRRAEAQSRLTAEDGRFVEPGSDAEALSALLELEQGGETLASGAARLRRLGLLVRLQLWDEALPEALALCGDPSVTPQSLHFLYQCYAGMGKTRRALAAAIESNAHPGHQPRVPDLEIDNLRWLYRADPVPAEVTGKVIMLIDLQRDADALGLLCSAGLLPPEGAPVQREDLAEIRSLPQDVQSEVMDLLARTNTYADGTMTVSEIPATADQESVAPG